MDECGFHDFEQVTCAVRAANDVGISEIAWTETVRTYCTGSTIEIFDCFVN